MGKSNRIESRARRAVDVAAGGAVSTVRGFADWTNDLLGRARAAGLIQWVRTGDEMVIEYSSEDAVRVFAPAVCADQVIRLWDANRMIYRVDPTLADELLESDLGAAFPSDVFRRVPHPDPCLVFATPISTPHPGGGIAEYTMAFITGSRPTNDGSAVCPLHHPETTALSVLLAGQCVEVNGSREHIMTTVLIDLDNDRVTISGIIELILDQWTGDVIGRRAQMEPVLQRVVPTLVYVCSETPDLRPMPVATPAAARPTRSATSAQVMELGWRVGKALLAWRRTHDANDGDGVGAGVRPHIRRGHLHTYWTGPLDGPRRAVVRWLLPIRVNMDDDTDTRPIQVVPVGRKPRGDHGG